MEHEGLALDVFVYELDGNYVIFKEVESRKVEVTLSGGDIDMYLYTELVNE